jgi:hypothetical protein
MQMSRGTVSVRVMEIAVALLIMTLGAVVMYDNWRIGARWSDIGPQAGYFPFYVGVMIFGSSAVVFVRALFDRSPWEAFAEPAQLRSIAALLVPTIIYIGLIYFIGIYIASTLYLVYFMRVLGHYKWQIIAPVAIGVPAILFALFEIWFLVPLPKGPIESFFGF